MKLCDIGFGASDDLVVEAEEHFFDKLKEALNLRQTMSSQLLAALILRGIPVLDSKARHDWVHDEQKMTVFSHAWKLLVNGKHS
jgi:hypothetical protein